MDDRSTHPAGVLRAPVGPRSDSNAMGGVPSTTDARLSPSMSGQADLSSDAGAPRQWGGGMHDDELHYRRFRDEHQRTLDDEYRAWRAQRQPQSKRPDDAGATPSHGSGPAQAESEGDAPRDEGALRSLGRAISDTVTGSQATYDPVDYRVRP